MMPREAMHPAHARARCPTYPPQPRRPFFGEPGLMAGQATPSAPGTLRRLEPAARWFGGGSTHEDWLIYDRARFRDRPLPI